MAFPHRLTEGVLDGDHYAQKGVALPRDAASVVAAALRRDAFDMEERGGEPNIEQAKIQKELAASIVRVLNLANY
jgi:hypothetical protein